MATITRFRGAGTEAAVAFSPDGRTIAAGGGDRVELRDADSRKLRATLTQHGTSGKAVPGIRSLAFSPDGGLLAVGTDRGVVGLWDVAERRQVGLTHGDPTDTIESVAFSPDGKLLATGSGDGVRLWNAHSDTEKVEEVAALDDEGSTSHVAFSPDGRTLASAGYNSSSDIPDEAYAVRLWDLPSRKVRRTLYDSRQIWGMAFSPDGRTVATTDERDTVLLFDAAGGREKGSLLDESDAELRTVAYSPDGKTLAVVMGAEVRLWDLADRKRTTSLMGDPLTAENVKDVVSGRTAGSWRR